MTVVGSWLRLELRRRWRALAVLALLIALAAGTVLTAVAALWGLVLIGPFALLLANLLAAVPGRRATRLPVSQVLRAE